MTERKRGRPPQRVRPSSKTPKRKPAKASVEKGQLYKAKRILDEDKANYLIEWDEINPKTKKLYEPSWHPKACATPALIAQWKQDKAGKEWSAQGIVAENDYSYKISWEDDPKTGEVYQDTWEPKAFASEAIVRDWELRKADLEARAKKTLASNDRGSVSESEEDVQEHSDESDDDALQQQIAQEIQSSPSRSDTRGP
ncbi:Chromo domain-like protein [Lasiodiplodia theobromae]|nr:Chromo domain-like protein [Lasiodiplodia theobromae]